MKKRYEKPMAKIEDTTTNGAQAYSAAAVPVAAPAVEPVIAGTATLVAAVVIAWC